MQEKNSALFSFYTISPLLSLSRALQKRIANDSLIASIAMIGIQKMILFILCLIESRRFARAEREEVLQLANVCICFEFQYSIFYIRIRTLSHDLVHWCSVGF